MVSNYLEKAAVRELISLALLILDSEVLDFKEDLSGAVLGGS